MKRSRFYVIALVLACFTEAVLAQPFQATLELRHESEFRNGGQYIRATVFATFDPDAADLFASTSFDIMMSEPVFDFMALVDHDPRQVEFEPPAIFRNVTLGQIHFPDLGLLGDPSNPIPILEFNWFSTDMTRRDLEVAFPEIRYIRVYPDSSSGGAVTIESGHFPTRLMFAIPIGIPCRADIDADGELTIFDFLAFQNAFSAGDPIADFDGDGELTIFDFLAFQNEFDAGCE